MKSKAQVAVTPQLIAASKELVDNAAHSFANVERMTALDRKRTVKLKRGAHQVIPTIAHLARKFAIEVPGMTIDDIAIHGASSSSSSSSSWRSYSSSSSSSFSSRSE